MFSVDKSIYLLYTQLHKEVLHMTYKDAYEKIEQFKFELKMVVEKGSNDLVILRPEDAKELFEAFNLIFV